MTATPATVAPSGLVPAGRRGGVPARGGEIELIGELEGSGYREAPRLVRRADGQLIKLTPLLYELLDAIDGRSDHEQLAAELSSRVGKVASAEDVRFLIERKLRPLGVLEGDGVQPELQKANPLLALHPRFVITRPRLTRALTRPFVWLFRAPVMVFFSLAFAAISGWLLFDKGLASALHEAMYEPGLILAIWGLIVLSAAFHEIGHAAACRYGGATPGVMGGGIYLIWPAFYTEVSDAYRLGRRARLRVDLGGLYFSAIFAVLTTGVWYLTEVDALLLVIAFQLMQMVRQLVPFIRADGYHILADLTGVPDLFSRIKPTLLGLLPTRWGRPENKVLKPWARALVTSWVLFTVPVLVGGLAFIVLAFPRIVATAWDSLNLRWDLIGSHWGSGDVAAVATDAISIGLVALPALGIAYLILRLARRTSKRVWRATDGHPRQRALAAVAAAGLIAALGWAWWPDNDYRVIAADEQGPVPTVLATPPAVPTVQYVQVPYLNSAYGFAPAQASLYLLPAQALTVIGVEAPPDPIATDPPAKPSDAPPASGEEDPLRPVPAAAADTAAAATPAVALEAPEPAAPAPEPAPAEPATEPATADAWPFPWDPPEAAEPGDNLAMAVNTTDGASLWDFASALVIEDAGNPVLQENE